jgi:hypothetical protein
MGSGVLYGTTEKFLMHPAGVLSEYDLEEVL